MLIEEYKILGGKPNFKELETEINNYLRSGWRTVGGLTFFSGFAYQSVIRDVAVKKELIKTDNAEEDSHISADMNENKLYGANEAIRAMEELT